MNVRKQFEEETGEPAVYNPNRMIGEAIRVNHEYLEWLEAKLKNTPHNSDYAKCPCCNEPWNIEEHNSCQCGAFIKKRL